MSGSVINAIEFYLTGEDATVSGADALDGNYVVILSEVDSTTMTSLIDVSSATVAFDGYIKVSRGEKPITINLTTPYLYGGGNLLVTTMCTSSYWAGSCRYYGINCENAACESHRDESPYDASATGGNVKNFMPKTTFYYGDGQATVTTAPTANDRDYGPSSVIYVVNYAFASGADSSWLMNSSNNLTFTIKRSRMDDLTFGNVAGVFVDDTAVPDSSFGLEQGSAVITLSAEYMKTLAEGKHSFRVEFTDPYTVTTSFTIVKASPQTGEFASPMLIVLSGMFLAAVAAFVVKSRKA